MALLSILISARISTNSSYGEFKEIKMYDEITLIGKPYVINETGNDYAFNYQNYLYSLRGTDLSTPQFSIRIFQLHLLL